MMRGILFILLSIASARQISLLYNKTAYVYSDRASENLIYPYFDNYGTFLLEDTYTKLVFLKSAGSSTIVKKSVDGDNNNVKEVYVQNGYTDIYGFTIGESDRMLLWIPENIDSYSVVYLNGNNKTFEIVYCGTHNFEYFDNIDSVENVIVYVSPDYPGETFGIYPVNRDNHYCNGIQWDIDGSTITFVGNRNINSSIVEKAWNSTNSSMEHVIISNGIWAIGDGAFKNREFKTIELPVTLTSIGQEAFAGNTLLETIDIPPGVTRIESRTFANCTSLETIRLPYLLEYISPDAFYGSINLETILFCGERDIITDSFSGLEKNVTVNVMKGRYKSKTFAENYVHVLTEIEKCEIVDSFNRGEDNVSYEDLVVHFWMYFIFIFVGLFRFFGYIVMFVAFYILRWKKDGDNKEIKKMYIWISLTLFGIGVVFSVVALLLTTIPFTKTDDECFGETNRLLFAFLKIFILVVSLAKEFLILLGVYFLIFRVNKKGTIIGFVLLAVSLIMACVAVALMICVLTVFSFEYLCFFEQTLYTTYQVGIGFYIATTIPDWAFVSIVVLMVVLFCLPCYGFVRLHINFYRSVNAKDEKIKDMDEYKHLMTDSHHEMTA